MKILVKWKLLVALIVVILLFCFHIMKENLDFTSDNSLYSEAPEGGRIYYLLLRKIGYRVSPWRKPLSSLADHDKVLLTISPSSHFSESECTHIEKWVKKGGELLVADGSPNAIYSHFGIIVYPGGRKRPREIPVALALRGGGAKSIIVTSGMRIKFSRNIDVEHLIFDELGTVMARLTLGNGHITVMTAPEIFSNTGLLKGDNAIAMVNIPCFKDRRKSLNLDEYHHGLSQGRSQVELFSLPLKLFLLQLLLIALLYFISRSIRFKRMIPLPSPEKRESREFISVMARLLQRAGAGKDVLSILFSDVRRKTAARCGLPSGADLPDISRCLSDDRKCSYDEVLAFLERCEKTIDGGNLDEKTLIVMAQRLDEFGKEESYGQR
ncbi:MAG: DUF4350 domain-containing protein [Candidatus Xenobiia bacterium LiM19]